jgi:prevent-host-death family protein
MRIMELQQLGEHLDEILEYVQAGETIEITNQNEVVARVVPVQPQKHDKEAIVKALADLDRLAAQISAHWPAGVSAEDAVNDVRGNS